MGRLARLAGRQKPETADAPDANGSSERREEFEHAAAELRTAVIALRSDVEGLRERAAEAASRPAREDLPRVESEPASEDQAPGALDQAPGALAEAEASESPGDPPAAHEGGRDDPERDGETASEGSEPTARLSQSSVAKASGPDAPDRAATVSANGATVERAERRRPLFGRVGLRRRRSSHDSVTRTCMVCESTFDGSEDELRASGGKLVGGRYICAQCQHEGWALPG